MSQFHEDYMANKGEYKFKPVKAVTSIVAQPKPDVFCIWPECDCELLCDRIRCEPPVKTVTLERG